MGALVGHLHFTPRSAFLLQGRVLSDLPFTPCPCFSFGSSAAGHPYTHSCTLVAFCVQSHHFFFLASATCSLCTLSSIAASSTHPSVTLWTPLQQLWSPFEVVLEAQAQRSMASTVGV